MLFNDTVKCQDYTTLDSVVRETLFSVDMFQCTEMYDVLKILCELFTIFTVALCILTLSTLLLVQPMHNKFALKH
jgi:hypothetical protein